MQVYNREKKCFTCKNKYYGRQLSEDGFKQTLRQFLHNGKRLQIDTMDAITTKLKALRSIISNLDSFRFFTSSLLILYDSGDIKSPTDKKLPALTTVSDDHERENYVPNNDVSFIPSSSQTASQDGRYNVNKKTSLAKKSSSPINANNSNHHHQYNATTSHQSTTTGKKVNKRGGSGSGSATVRGRTGKSKAPRVDIRLIDFAHATHKGMGDSIVYTGPDDGILLGLDSLINIFHDIRENWRGGNGDRE